VVTLEGEDFGGDDVPEVQRAGDGSWTSLVGSWRLPGALAVTVTPPLRAASHERLRLRVRRGSAVSDAVSFELEPGRAYFVSSAAVEHADGSATLPFPSLTAAADHLAAGDVAYLLGGVYVGAQVVRASGARDAPIVIRPLPGADVLLVGAASHESKRIDTLSIFGADVSVEGLRITNAHGPGSAVWIAGPPWVASDARRVRISGCDIFSARGQGIMVSGSDSLIEDNSIHGNGALGAQEHGVYVESSLATIRRNVVFDNFGYGIHLWRGSGDDGGHNLIELNYVYANGFGALAAGVTDRTAGIVVGAHEPYTTLRRNVSCYNAQFGLLALDHQAGTQMLENVTCFNRLGGTYLRDPGPGTIVDGGISYEDRGFAMSVRGPGVRSDRNIFFRSEGALRFEWRDEVVDWSGYRQLSGLDGGSMEIDPRFILPPRRHFVSERASRYDFCASRRPFLCPSIALSD
jgi:hypothetical protein